MIIKRKSGIDLRSILFVETMRSEQLRTDMAMLGFLVGAMEFFAGKQELTKAQRRQGMKAVALDMKYSPTFELGTEKGLRTSLILLRFVNAGGLHWMGVECKTFVWMCRVWSGRSKANPRGFEISVPEFGKANTMAATAVFRGIGPPSRR